jgi:hypothetical protein
MRKRITLSRSRRGEQGYALMLAVFLTTLMLIATLAAAPSVRTERQREKEEEMIWRGKQYVRAIKLYYRKNGRFPTTIDDLTKPKVGAVRYLRQQYKDPMNKEDGTWRLIYVGPMGQLIGSLKPPQTIQFQGPGGAAQPTVPAPGTSSTSTSAFGGSFGSTQSFTGIAPQQGTAGAGAQPGAPGTTPQAPGTSDSTSQGLSAPAPVDTSNFVGGNIIGIGSKIDKKSVTIYEKATNYHLFEFVWDPSKDALTLGGSTTQVGTPVAPGQAFGQGQGTFGSQPGPTTQPAGNPGSLQPTLPPLAPTSPQQ